MAREIRIGHGYDLHRLEPLDAPAGDVGGGKRQPVRPLVVGGVAVPGAGPDGVARGPVAHSDGDVLLHAVTDALLGALALPDIGQLFPDNAAENDGRDSADFVRAAMAKLAADPGGAWRVGNLDATVILERPRIGPLKGAMRERLAALLGVVPERVNVKGKSHERVDAVGEGRAIEAHAVVVLERG